MPNETNEIDERTIALMAAAILGPDMARASFATARCDLAYQRAVTLARALAAEVQRTRPTGEA
jgi:hypothetical protein